MKNYKQALIDLQEPYETLQKIAVYVEAELFKLPNQFENFTSAPLHPHLTFMYTALGTGTYNARLCMPHTVRSARAALA